MLKIKTLKKWCHTFVSMSLLVCISDSAVAARALTLIQVSDLHGALRPHAGIIHEEDGTERYVTQAGGVAKVATVIKQIRKATANSLTLGIGDMVHGGAEVLFTVGDAIMPALNSLGFDAYTPGNWEYGYGPAVFRNRFASFGPRPPLPGNIRVMADAYDGEGVSKATFTTLAINLYNDATSAPLPSFLHNKRVLPAYKMFNLDGVTVAVIGITSAIIEHANPAFNIGLRFTQGHTEMPGIIAEVKGLGAELIVVLSELGLAQNLQMGREFDDINVIFSGHTHEVTLAPFIADEDGITAMVPGEALSSEDKHRLMDGGTLVTEVVEDTQLGRLDLRLDDHGKIKDVIWTLVPVGNDVLEDPVVKALIDHAEEPFIAGADDKVARHSFLPGGFCPAGIGCGDTTKRGHQLTQDLDTVVGYTDVMLHRRGPLERLLDNFISDAFRAETDAPAANQTDWSGVDLASTNGFRFGTPVLSSREVAMDAEYYDGRTTGEITLRDLYTIYPLGAGIVAAEFPATSLLASFETLLENVFSRHAFRQRGGWYLGFSDSLRQYVDLINRPLTAAGKRIVKTWIHGEPIDLSKHYVKVGFYGHSYPLGQVSRTLGGIKSKYFGLSDPDDYNSDILLYEPKNSENIIVLNRVKQVAPDNFLHPVHIFRRYLDTLPGKQIAEAQFGVGRIINVDSNDPALPAAPLPVAAPLPGITQHIDGLGPEFFGRITD